ncbi:hypothetical protein [Halogeometricum luteum]|uniref:Uncharacterized protein n=1 Tax=Halogeometricum luteum TaxID=2950537 RepID=A0ABU2G534_9EURY|nr:hypothetical protein [Halogeometricum sp. S3BR5-2]MDS0295902.1 hypothetical protein [Halogeometricum sp. S3BR5-2]
MSSPSRWWYGVALFPGVVLTTAVQYLALFLFVSSVSAGGDPAVAPANADVQAGTALGSFVLVTLASWLGILAALVVLVCLALDVRTLRKTEPAARTPSLAWTLAGLAHLAGAVFAPALVVSVPTLSYYVYRRYGDGRRAA